MCDQHRREPRLACVPVVDPVFDDGVVIILSANERYVPYVSVVLQSLMENASANRNYDVVVLNSDIAVQSRRILTDQVSASNFSLRFYDAMPLMSTFSDLRIYGHFQIETYFRLLVPEIMPNCHKALYLDSDLVVLRDAADLYDIDMGDCMIAATRDADSAGMYNGYDPVTKDYVDEVLGLEDPFGYFQAGVLLLNLDAFRARYTSQEMLECAASREWTLLDQDVLNYLAKGSVCYVDMAWNTLMDWEHLRRNSIIGVAPRALRDDYERARRNPFIVHYAGPDNKPWEFRDADLGAYFWDYAGRCPYAEELRFGLEQAMTSSRYRLRRVGHFWLYRVILRGGDYVAPPGSHFRSFCYRVYRASGGER